MGEHHHAPPLAVARTQAEHAIGRKIALASMSVGVFLSALKIIVGWKAGSTALVSDGLEAAGDVLLSGIVYAGLWLASKPPDYEHPYGHGRYETLSGLAVGSVLLVAGIGIFWHGFKTLGERASVELFALYPILAAVVLKSGLAATKFRIGRKIRSSAVEADGWHDVTDLLSTFIAFVAIGLTVFEPQRFAMADRVGAMVIGMVICFLAVRVVRRSVAYLVDVMPDPEQLDQIRRVALSVPGTLGIEKCYARRTGLKYYVDLHLEVDPEMTVRQSHEIATQVRFAVTDSLHWVADVLVHVEPAPPAPQAARKAAS